MAIGWEDPLPDDQHLDFYDRYDEAWGESYDDSVFFDDYDIYDNNYVTKSIEMEGY